MKLNLTKTSMLIWPLLFIAAMILSGCTSSLSKPEDDTRLLLSKVKNTPIQAHNHNPDVTDDNISQALPKEVYYSNLWDEMSKHFDLANQHYGQYDRYIAFYNKRQRHMEKISQRAKPYLHYIFNEVKQREMPYEIALLPAVESGFRAHARSHQRAVGLWQFIPSTAEIFDLDRNWWYDGRKDVISSTQAALDYLEKLYKLNNNDWLLALASYNAGLGNVYRAQKKYRKKHKNQPGIDDYQPNFWEIQPYLPKETQGYVPKLLAVSHIIEYADLFQVAIEPIENQPYFAEIKLKKQVALNQVAKLSQANSDELALLNPGYHRLATPPKGPHSILLPIEEAEKFQSALNDNQHIFSIQWQKHKIKSGDSLSVIAQKYKTSSRAIQKLNGMKNSKIRAGKTLLIPIPSDAAESVKLASNTQNVSVISDINRTESKPKNTDFGIHTVKAGDSLWELAKHYHVSTTDLKNWNGISLKKPLNIGQKLKIYSDKFGRKVEHTLKAGESLWTLAKRYKVRTRKIAAWNEIPLNKTLQPGMKLVVWIKDNTADKTLATAEYRVKTGDNLWNIAKANKISAKKLAKHNKLSLTSLLKPGQVLKIPLES